MSDFIQQQGVECEFSSSDSWVILSPIEQSIKRKIEAIGTPLKDWDINIYRGVLTGYNEAFIISTEKRNEILANCQSEEERQRTAELIRPFFHYKQDLRIPPNEGFVFSPTEAPPVTNRSSTNHQQKLRQPPTEHPFHPHSFPGFMKEEKNSDLRIAAPFIHPHPSARNHTPCASHRNGVPLQKFKTITQ